MVATEMVRTSKADVSISRTCAALLDTDLAKSWLAALQDAGPWSTCVSINVICSFTQSSVQGFAYSITVLHSRPDAISTLQQHGPGILA